MRTHRFLRPCIASIALLLAVLAPVRAGAQTAEEERAATLYREGKALYEAGRAADAEAKFQAAWDLKRSFDVGGNLGTVEMVLKQYRDAAEHLSYALKNFPVGASPQQRTVLEAQLAEAKTHVGAIDLQVVDGAEVLVDGKRVGATPLGDAIFVEPGDHVIEARRGAAATKQSIHADAGTRQAIALKLAGAGEVQPPSGGEGPKTPVLVAGGALAGVGVAMGLVFMAASNGKASSANKLVQSGAARSCPVGGVGAQGACAELHGDLDDKATFANASLWSFVGGGAAAGATVLYWALAPRSRAPETGVRAVPIVSPSAAGLSLRGSW